MYSRIIYICMVFITVATFVTTLVHAAIHLEILTQPMDKVIQERKRMTLKCRVSDLSNKFVVQWYKGEEVISSGKNITGTDIDRQRYFITGDTSRGQYNLKIQNIQRNDTGNYTCRIYKMLERRLFVKSRSANVQVVYTPDPLIYPSCIRRQSESGFEENEIVPVCFSLMGAPPIHLDLVDYNGKVYQDGVHLDYDYKPSFVYMFVNVTRKLNRSGYYCRARSPYFKYYEVKCLVHINIIEKPKVSIEPLQSTINLLDDASFLCKAQSKHPILEYKWELSPSKESNRLSYFDRQRLITLSEITKNDENTTLTCYARTEIAIASATTIIKINKIDKISNHLISTTEKMLENIKETSLNATEISYTETIRKTTESTEQKKLSDRTFSAFSQITLPTIETSENGNIFLALCMLIVFQFMIILLACVFCRSRTKKSIKLPVQTEFRQPDSIECNPV